MTRLLPPLLMATLLVVTHPTMMPASAQAASPGLVQAARAAPVPLLIADTGGADPAALYGVLSGVVAADAGAANRLAWDIRRGEVTDAGGKVVATVSGGDLEAQLARVQGVIDKWTVVLALTHPSGPPGLDARVEPNAQVHHQGDRITIVIGGYRHPYFTLLNLASDGTVNFVYPVETGTLHDSLTLPPGSEYRLPLQVTPPFGADHFIAIASAAALTGLHQAPEGH